MRVAYFSPLSPMKSGIANYSEELLPFLSKYMEIDVFIDDYEVAVSSQCRIYRHKLFEAKNGADKYDIIIYQLGNSSDYHSYMYDYLFKYPGLVVLHDYVMHHFYLGITLGKGDAATYSQVMSYSHGPQGLEFANRVIQGNYINNDEFFNYPLNKKIIDSSLGIIAHSAYVKRLIERLDVSTPVKHINQHFILANNYVIPQPDKISSDIIGPNNIVFASFGHITPAKRIDVALRAFARLIKEVPNAVYVLVGQSHYNVEELIDKLDLSERVILKGYSSNEEFEMYLGRADICINLRYPSAGETSASLTKIMGLGKPVIVSNYAQFADYPDDCCAKVDVDEIEEELLLQYMLFLAKNKEFRDQMGQNAKSFIATTHSIEESAHQYNDFVKRLIAVNQLKANLAGSKFFHGVDEIFDPASFTRIERELTEISSELGMSNLSSLGIPDSTNGVKVFMGKVIKFFRK